MGRRKPSDESAGVMAGSGGDLDADGSLGWGVDVGDRTGSPELTEALTGRFNEHHAFLARMYLEVIDQRTRQIEELNTRIEVVMEPLQSFSALICTIPGLVRAFWDGVGNPSATQLVPGRGVRVGLVGQQPDPAPAAAGDPC